MYKTVYLLFILILLKSCSAAPSDEKQQSSDSSPKTTNYTFFASYTNCTGTNWSGTTYFSITNSPNTWFSNFMINNTISISFVIYDVSNCLIDNVFDHTDTFVSYFTNNQGDMTNFDSFITVDLVVNKYSNTLISNPASVVCLTVTNAPVSWFSNFIISNGVFTVMDVYTVTNGFTNFVPIWTVTNARVETNSQPTTTNLIAYVAADYVFMSDQTNCLGTNGGTVGYFNIHNTPATYFSNYVVTNSAYYPFVETVITNVMTNSVLLFNLTNNRYYTNLGPATTNFLVEIGVSFQLFASLTNQSTNLVSTNYYNVNGTNYIISNYNLTNIVTNISNALTNAVTIYKTTNFMMRYFCSNYSSTNYWLIGSVWTTSLILPHTNWFKVCYGNGTFVALSGYSFGSSVAATSTDGSNWTQRSIPSATWKALTYGNGLFVAVAGDICATSPDGINWTTNSMPSGNWSALAYGNGIFVAMNLSSASVANSPDGVNWTVFTVPSELWQIMDVTYGNGTFVAVTGYFNAESTVGTSTDGTNWMERTNSATAYWQSITYGNGMFVALARTTNVYSTSSNGINWTTRTMGSIYSDWTSIAYGNGVFVATTDNGFGVYRSSDGINWTSGTISPSLGWCSVAYGNGMFVALLYYSTNTAYSR